MRFYDITGLELPCCFIKDATTFTSIAALATDLAKGVLPRPAPVAVRSWLEALRHTGSNFITNCFN